MSSRELRWEMKGTTGMTMSKNFVRFARRILGDGSVAPLLALLLRVVAELLEQAVLHRVYETQRLPALAALRGVVEESVQLSYGLEDVRVVEPVEVFDNDDVVGLLVEEVDDLVEVLVEVGARALAEGY